MPLDVQHDLRLDLVGLIGCLDRAKPGAIDPRTIEPPHLDVGEGNRLGRKSIGRHKDLTAAGRRLDDDRTALLFQPDFAASRGVDDLHTPITVSGRRRYVDHGDVQTRKLTAQARALADLEGVKPLFELYKGGRGGRTVGIRRRLRRYRIGQFDAFRCEVRFVRIGDPINRVLFILRCLEHGTLHCVDHGLLGSGKDERIN